MLLSNSRLFFLPFQLFKGLFYYCEGPDADIVQNKTQCLGRTEGMKQARFRRELVDYKTDLNQARQASEPACMQTEIRLLTGIGKLPSNLYPAINCRSKIVQLLYFSKLFVKCRLHVFGRACHGKVTISCSQSVGMSGVQNTSQLLLASSSLPPPGAVRQRQPLGEPQVQLRQPRPRPHVALRTQLQGRMGQHHVPGARRGGARPAGTVPKEINANLGAGCK